jgi:hypothetical protein
MRTRIWRRTTAASAVTSPPARPALQPAAATHYSGDLPILDDAPPLGPRTSSVRRDLVWGLRAAVVPWAVARVVVAGALATAHELVNQAKPSVAVATRVHEGLLGWDAGWYRSIAQHGYAGAGHLSLRFFPLVPLLTRAVSYVPGVGFGASLIVVANVSSLVGVVLLAVLARRETGDDALARRAAWLMCLAPAAFTQVMGYAEGTLLALSVGTLLALRARAWWWAAALGLLAGATRPVGVLLVVPALIEVVGGWRSFLEDRHGAHGVARAAAVVGPVLGFGAFLGWVGWRYGDALAPLRVQQQGSLRGGVADPLRTLAHDASLLVHGRHLGSAMHLPWALLAIALLVVSVRRWPIAYGGFAAAVLVVALTASNLDGFERYGLSAFPLVLAGATLTARPRVEHAVLTLAAAGLALYALLAFTNLYVP